MLKQPWLPRSALCQHKHLCIHALGRIGKLVLLENSLHDILSSFYFLWGFFVCWVFFGSLLVWVGFSFLCFFFSPFV